MTRVLGCVKRARRGFLNTTVATVALAGLGLASPCLAAPPIEVGRYADSTSTAMSPAASFLGRAPSVRPAAGALTQLPGAAGCLRVEPVDGCSLLRELPHAEASSTAISPDERNVYVVTSKMVGEGTVVGSGVAILSRHAATGELTQLPGDAGCVNEDGADGCAQGRALASARAVAISPDGRNVYVTSVSGVAVFARAGDGGLTQAPGSAGCVSEAPRADCGQARAIAGGNDVVVSPDGQQVYVAAYTSHAIAVLRRHPGSGSLSQSAGSAGCIGDANGCAPGRALTGPQVLALSGDGRDLYAGGSFADTGAIAMLRRDPRDGTLTQQAGTNGCVLGLQPRRAGCSLARGLLALSGLVASGDGTSVYAGSLNNNAVIVFNRDGRTGALREPRGRDGCVSNQAGGGPPGTVTMRTCAPALYLNPIALAASPRGENVYVLSASTVTVFAREKGTGALRQRRGVAYCVATYAAPNCAGFQGLRGPLASLAVAPDGRNVYVSSGNALTAFRRR